MDTLLLPPAATAFEMASALVSALLYLAVGIAALARAPRDIRARMFFLTALASARPTWSRFYSGRAVRRPPSRCR